MSDYTSRVGRFKVSGRFFHWLAPGEGVNLFHNMVVLQCHQSYMTDQREYFAIHPDFRPRKEGEVVPEYNAVFSDGQVFPKWEEIKP